MKNINTKAIPFEFLRMLIAIDRSIEACETQKHLDNTYKCWLTRLNDEYGSTKNKDMQQMISEAFASWAIRAVEIRREQARRIEDGNRIINALDISY